MNQNPVSSEFNFTLLSLFLSKTLFIKNIKKPFELKLQKKSPHLANEKTIL